MTDTAAMPNETHDWDEVAARMRKQADEGFPPAWQPEQPDDEIIGVLARVTMQAPTSYGPAPVVELVMPASGARFSVWLFHTVLRRAFERERPALGETVLIRYLGKRRPESGGNAYDDYRLIVDRPLASDAPDWEAMADRYDRGTVGGRIPEDAGPPIDNDPDGEDIPF